MAIFISEQIDNIGTAQPINRGEHNMRRYYPKTIFCFILVAIFTLSGCFNKNISHNSNNDESTSSNKLSTATETSAEKEENCNQKWYSEEQLRKNALFAQIIGDVTEQKIIPNAAYSGNVPASLNHFYGDTTRAVIEMCVSDYFIARFSALALYSIAHNNTEIISVYPSEDQADSITKRSFSSLSISDNVMVSLYDWYQQQKTMKYPIDSSMSLTYPCHSVMHNYTLVKEDEHAKIYEFDIEEYIGLYLFRTPDENFMMIPHHFTASINKNGVVELLTDDTQDSKMIHLDNPKEAISCGDMEFTFPKGDYAGNQLRQYYEYPQDILWAIEKTLFKYFNARYQSILTVSSFKDENSFSDYCYALIRQQHLSESAKQNELIRAKSLFSWKEDFKKEHHYFGTYHSAIYNLIKENTHTDYPNGIYSFNVEECIFRVLDENNVESGAWTTLHHFVVGINETGVCTILEDYYDDSMFYGFKTTA